MTPSLLFTFGGVRTPALQPRSGPSVRPSAPAAAVPACLCASDAPASAAAAVEDSSLAGSAAPSSSGAAPARRAAGATTAVLTTASRLTGLSACSSGRAARPSTDGVSLFRAWGPVQASIRGRRVAACAIRAPHVGAAVLVEPEVMSSLPVPSSGGDVASVLQLANEVRTRARRLSACVGASLLESS